VVADFNPSTFSQNFTKAVFPLNADHHKCTDKDKREDDSPVTRTVRSLASLDEAHRRELTFVRAVHILSTMFFMCFYKHCHVQLCGAQFFDNVFHVL